MGGIGEPSGKELECLANLKKWQAGLEFAEKWGGRHGRSAGPNPVFMTPRP